MVIVIFLYEMSLEIYVYIGIHVEVDISSLCNKIHKHGNTQYREILPQTHTPR